MNNVTMGNSVKNIGLYAFFGCTSLTSITIPDSVTNLGHGAFKGCSNLTSVIIGNRVEHLEGSTFYGCTSLSEVTIGNSVANIGPAAFSRCTSLTTLATTYGRRCFLTWGDYDNDGNLDVYVSSWEGAVDSYFHNEAGGRFSTVPATASWTVNGQPVYGSAVASADYDRDGWLDMVAGYWGNTASGIWGTNSVLHNVSRGQFTVDLNSPLALSHTWPESFAWVDYDDDGDPDLFGATSHDTNQLDILFENLGGGTFQRITNSPVVQFPDNTVGHAWGDYDNDGDLDVFIGNWNQSRLLYRNLGNGVFELDPTGPLNHVGEIPQMAQWGDYDNDGHLDLFLAQANGHNRLFHNRGDGTLDEVVAGGPSSESGNYGCAWGDYDNDGFLDLVLVNGNQAANRLFRNVLKEEGNTNHWLKVAPRGTASNRSAIGAKVRALATIGGQTFWQRRDIVSQTHQLDLVAHFGLGDATNVATLKIEWPSGHVTTTHDVAADQVLTIQEPPGVKCLGWDGTNMCLAITGNSGEHYELLTSTDITLPLTNWACWRTNLQTSRTMLVTNTSPLAPQRFHTAKPTP